MLDTLFHIYKKIDPDIRYNFSNTTATQDELWEVENKLGQPIPPSLRKTFMGFSNSIELIACMPEDFVNQLPRTLRGIGFADIKISISELVTAERSRKGWVEGCFNNVSDPYDKVWHNKLGFITVDNGDVIAFDLCDPKEDKQVIYLSHDDGDAHGYVLGKNFGDFFTKYLLIGACGREWWGVLPFINDATSGIDPYCDNAKMYREIIGLQW